MKQLVQEIIAGSPRANRLALGGMMIYAVIALIRIWQETRPDVATYIQIMLPDPMVRIYLDSFIPIVMIALSLLLLKRVHLPLAFAFFLCAPLIREVLRVVDEIPGMTQPSPMILVITVPLLILTGAVILRQRFRSLDALAVLFSYWAILLLYMLYHLAFIFPAYHLTNAQRDEATAYLMTLAPDALAGRMEDIAARNVSSLTQDDIRYLNDMSDMNIDLTFPGESAARIMSQRPETIHAWSVVGRTFVDQRIILYDGRDIRAPARLWALPANWAQEHLILIAAGFYLTITIVAYFWTIMALFICHIHGRHVARLKPFAKRKWANAA